MNKEKTNQLPQHAIERLQGLRKQGGSEGIFTSDLSVNEFLLIKEAGFEPLGLVMGSSVYHIGFQIGRFSKNMEMDVLTQAMYEARELAMTRMQEEADALGADGIVAVKLKINHCQWGKNNMEFIAIGTAVFAKDRSIDYRTALRKPFTSNLSGQDFWTLLKTGYRPLSLVMGTCVYHIAYRNVTQALGSVGKNTELTNYSQALYDARELAMERMQNEAQHEEAEGVVGVRIEEESYGWSSHVIEFFSVGTAVVPCTTDGTFEKISEPQLTLTLNDPQPTGDYK